MHCKGECVAGGVHDRRDGHCSGRYASSWNAFLLLIDKRFLDKIDYANFMWLI